MGRHIPPNRPYQCEPMRCYNTQDSNTHLYVFLIQVCTEKWYRSRGEDNHTATVCALPFYSIDRKLFSLLAQQPSSGPGPPHTQRRTTVGRTPLDEWLSRRRDLYLTTHNKHARQTSMTPVGFEPTISAGKRPHTYTLDRAAIGTGNDGHNSVIIQI